jgi:orotate phosphoribosyltransferase
LKRPIQAVDADGKPVANAKIVPWALRSSHDHGTNQFIEGPGQTALIVEDVVTTGGSSLKAIERAEAFGLKIVGVMAIIDRMEGGAEAFAKLGYPLSSLLTIRDFGIEPPA